MKKTILIVIILLIPLAVFGSADVQPTYSGHEKIGLGLKHQWRRAMRKGDLLQETRCMVKLNAPANRKTLNDLRNAGLKVNTVLRTVVTGKISIGDLPILVSLDEVRSVEGNKKIGFK